MTYISPNVLLANSGERNKYLVIERPPSIVRLDSGAPSFPTPPHIGKAGQDAIKDGHTSYAPWRGTPELLRAVCEYLQDDFAVRYETHEVLITHGGSSAIYTVMATVLAPGDEVILLDPTYSLYAPDAIFIGAKPVPVAHNSQYHIDIGAVRAAITDRTRAILICNPNNPTGVAYTHAELGALLRVCKDNDLFLVVDEAYSKILQAGVTHIPILSFQEHRERIVLLQTFSKTYAMTGWRLGFAVGPQVVISQMLGLHLSIIGPVCTFVQRAGVAALRGPQDCIADFGMQYQRRGALMYRLAQAIEGLHPVTPQGGFYLYCRYDADLPAVEVRERLWKAGVAVRTGSEFGVAGERHLRFTYAVDEETIERGMGIVAQTFRGL